MIVLGDGWYEREIYRGVDSAGSPVTIRITFSDVQIGTQDGMRGTGSLSVGRITFTSPIRNQRNSDVETARAKLK